MGSTTTEERYFQWLCAKVNVEYGHDTDRTYKGLLRKLHEREFAWIVPNDSNRAGDGLVLRIYFRRENGNDLVLPTQEESGASVLEVILGLSAKLEFLAEGEEGNWAWKLIENIDLHKMWDPITPRKNRIIDDRLESVLFRTYNSDGTGGFFPLAWPDPEKDQRKIELWYQMAAYILEMHEP